MSQTDETFEPQPDPRDLARSVALEVADEPEHVGDFAGSQDLGDGVTDFRFACHIKGYEGWQWSVTLYHDVEAGVWTVNESSLTPTEQALCPPEWVPWKDRLEPTDLAPTDSIGTDPDDPRMEEGEVAESSLPDVNEAAETFRLTRRHVLSHLGRSQTAKRWYEGPRGPKAMSTRTAGGNPCSTCGFLVPLTGELSHLFGVCANKWSPDDGRVVSLDHGCGEHSEIAPPEPGRLWVQSKPAYDDLHIDVVTPSPRDERGQIELLEEIVSEAVGDASADDETDETVGESSETEATAVDETQEVAEAQDVDGAQDGESADEAAASDEAAETVTDGETEPADDVAAADGTQDTENNATENAENPADDDAAIAEETVAADGVDGADEA